MGKVKTGALIVIEDEILLNEYVRTGIDIDAIISSQLLINILDVYKRQLQGSTAGSEGFTLT